MRQVRLMPALMLVLLAAPATLDGVLAHAEEVTRPKSTPVPRALVTLPVCRKPPEVRVSVSPKAV